MTVCSGQLFYGRPDPTEIGLVSKYKRLPPGYKSNQSYSSTEGRLSITEWEGALLPSEEQYFLSICLFLQNANLIVSTSDVSPCNANVKTKGAFLEAFLMLRCT